MNRLDGWRVLGCSLAVLSAGIVIAVVLTVARMALS